MTPNTDPQPQAKDLDLAKLRADDEQEWTRADNILFASAKAGAKTAVHSRTESELNSIARMALKEARMKFLRFLEEGKSLADFPNRVVTIAFRRSLDLLKKDTGYHRPPKCEESNVSAPMKESPEEFYENCKLLYAEDNPFLNADQFEVGKKRLEWAFEELERREPKMGKIYRAVIERLFFDNLQYDALAAEMGKPIGTVAVWRKRGMECLGEILEFDDAAKEVASNYHTTK